jgi:mono/diheme cytochrome c family protein
MGKERIVPILIGIFVFILIAAAGCTGGGPAETAPSAKEAPPSGVGGEKIFVQAGCNACHTLGGISQATVGPDLTHIGSGSTEEEIRESIIDPDAEVTEGFSPGIMPKDFGKRLTQKELDTLVAYLAQQK